MKKKIFLLTTAFCIMSFDAQANTAVSEARENLTNLSTIMKEKSINDGFNAINGFDSVSTNGSNSEERADASNLKGSDQDDAMNIVFCVEGGKIVAHPNPKMIGKSYAETQTIVNGLRAKPDGEVAISASVGYSDLIDLKTGKPIGGENINIIAWSKKKLLGYKNLEKGKGRKMFCAATFKAN